MENTARSEYAVEIINKETGQFLQQIDVYSSFDEAKDFIKTGNVRVDENTECFIILRIDYDDNENEIGTERCWKQDEDD